MKKAGIILITLSLIGLLCSHLQAKEDFAKKAQKSMDFMEYDLAIENFGQAIQEDPQRRDVRIKMAYAHFRLRQLNDAASLLTDELALFPDNLDAFILLSVVYFNQDRLDEAAAVCRKFNQVLEDAVLEEARKKGLKLTRREDKREFSLNYDYFVDRVRNKNPNFGLPSFVLGYYHKKRGDLDEAAKNFSLAIQRKYDLVDCYLQLIDIELEKESWQTGLMKSQEAIRAAGERSRFYALMGYALSHTKAAEQALLYLKRAVELKPYHVEALINLAKVYYNQRKFNLAVPLLKKVLELVPFDFTAKLLLGRSLESKSMREEESRPRLTKDFVDGVELKYEYTFAADINSVLQAVNQFAISLVRSGHLNEAVNYMGSFLELNDLSPELNYNLAQLYNTLDVVDKALRYAWRATELKDDYRDAYDLVGNIFFKMGDYANSIRSYEKVVVLDPKDAMSYYNLGCAYSAAENFVKAEENWKSAIQKEKGRRRGSQAEETFEDELEISLTVMSRPISFKAHKALGDYYLQHKMMNEALQEYKQAVSLEPGDPEPYYEIGKIYEVQERTQDAIRYYKRYLYLGGKREQEVKNKIEKLNQQI